MAVLTKITSRSLADNAVSSAKIQDGAIAVADVADGSISTAKLADDAVTQAKIGAGAVGNTEVNNSAAIASSKLADDPLSGTNAKALGAGASFTAEQQELHGTTFTASGTGATVTGDLKLKSLVDDQVTISGTGTITGSGGRILGEGENKAEYVDKTGGGFSGPIQAPNISAGKASIGELKVTDIPSGTMSGGTIGSAVKFPTGHIIQTVTHRGGAGGTSYGSSSVNIREVNSNMRFEITPRAERSKFLISGYCTKMHANNAMLKWFIGHNVLAISGGAFDTIRGAAQACLPGWDEETIAGLKRPNASTSTDKSGLREYGMFTYAHVTNPTYGYLSGPIWGCHTPTYKLGTDKIMYSAYYASASNTSYFLNEGWTYFVVQEIAQ